MQNLEIGREQSLSEFTCPEALPAQPVDATPPQNEMGLDPPTHSECSYEAHDEGSGGSSVVQEIVAET
jgi:hypothetical protein